MLSCRISFLDGSSVVIPNVRNVHHFRSDSQIRVATFDDFVQTFDLPLIESIKLRFFSEDSYESKMFSSRSY